MTKTDVVVIGAGAAGIGAAITLAEASKNVILLEKGNRYGGAGMFGAQGLFAVNSQQQQATNSSLTPSTGLSGNDGLHALSFKRPPH